MNLEAEVELALSTLGIGVSHSYVTRKTMHREVHLAESHGFCNPFLSEDGDLAVGVLAMVLHESSRLNEHTA